MHENIYFLVCEMKVRVAGKVVNQMVVFVLLVWIGLVFIGLGVSLYFYDQGGVERNKVNKYRRLRPSPADRSKGALEEQQFYRQLVKIENGPSRFSLTIAMVTLLLMLGLALSAIIS